MHDLRIDQDDLLRRVLAGGHVDHREPLADADLRRGQADAFRRVHRFEHVLDQLVQFRRVEFRDVLAAFLEHRLPVLHDRINHPRKFFTCSKYPW